MPRALSLKKSQQTNTQKSQKSITDFLKKPPTNVNKNPKSPVKKTAIDQTSSQYTSKRKASSPVLLDEIELADDADFAINSTSIKIKNGTIPKKVKTHTSPIRNKVLTPFKKSPNKENLMNGRLSPRKKLNLEPSSPQKEGIKLNNKDLKALATTDNVNQSSNDINHVNKESSKENVLENDNVIKMEHVSPSKHNTNSQRRSRTPKKSPLKEFQCSPINQLRTPNKQLQNVLSPSKSGSTPVKVLEFSLDDVCDDFGDEWDVDDIDEDGIEDLDLGSMQRCEILSLKRHNTKIELRLKNADNKKATCFVEGVWLDTPLTSGDIVSILATRDSSGQYSVNNTSGLLVLRPDHLLSSTSVVAGVFCKRKAVLQERWRGIDSGNVAMTTGILIHELVQKALSNKISSIEQLRSITDSLVKESVSMLYDAGLGEEEARVNIHNYIPPLADFINTYVADKPPTVARVQKDKNNWQGHIDKVLDIEENLCCPKLGLKGKIDATLQVTIHEKKGRQRTIVPLELKSGKASMSAEHRGQLVLYGMMLNLNNGEDPTRAEQRGLLLYLKDRVELREVSCGYPERRDLIMLRNQLVQYLAASPQDVDQEQLTDIEDASVLLQQKLPEPVDHHSACAKCPYLTLCSLHLWHTDGPSVSESHNLTSLRPVALDHLSAEHIKYFLHWTALLRMEERGQLVTSPLHALWTDSVEKREKRGTCAASLKLKSVEPSGDRFMHFFQRAATDQERQNGESKASKGPQEGDFSIVSIENRPWIAAGVVTVANCNKIHILLERDLTRRLQKDTSYHIDTYESYATTVQNLTNLGVLMEDSERAERLRKLIINKSTPEFEAKLPREVGRLGTKLMRSLNIQQQRGVLKALAAKDYALLQGLPGTGKTQTITVLIQMLVSLKQRVLVTAHTHSAVDNVLCRLPDSLRVMRLGSSARIASGLQKRSEQALTADCETPEQLSKLYDSMEVVGVTCLGSAHAMLARTTFDLCIVDEATQVLQCTVLRPLFAAKRFILVGDPEQLPPVVRSRAARRLGMEASLFHRLMREEATSTLQLQYRMNQALADIANDVAYNNRLKCADDNVAQARIDINLQTISNLTTNSPWLIAACSPEPENAAVFLDAEIVDGDVLTPTNKNPCANSVEACVVIALVETLKQGNIKSLDIGVIAPYRDQVSLLRRSLTHLGVEVSTVDQFQGRDKSVIIYSCTRHDAKDSKKVKEGEVLNDQRRLAVSVTRAKHKLLVVGNSTALRRYAPLQKLIKACKSVQLDSNIVNNLFNKYKTRVS